MAWLPQKWTAQRPRRTERSKAATEWHRLYNDRRWREYSRSYLASHPLCVVCEQQGRLVVAQCVDHIQAHRGDVALFWSEANHRALCVACNSRKAALSEGGFGRQRAGGR